MKLIKRWDRIVKVTIVGNRVFNLAIIVLVFFHLFSPVVLSQDAETEYGELKIEGSYIEKLVLEDKDHKSIEFNNPGEIIKLPIGQYHLIQVHLTGGYSCGFRTMLTDSFLIEIEENKQAEIKVGGPLEQFIEAERVGKYLVLNYNLVGIDGQNYIRTNLDKQPEFSIYKGSKLISSDKTVI